MADVKNILIGGLMVGVAVLGYVYYQSRQNTIELKLPTITIEKN